MNVSRLKKIEKALSPTQPFSAAIIFESEGYVVFNGERITIAEYDKVKSDKDFQVNKSVVS